MAQNITPLAPQPLSLGEMPCEKREDFKFRIDFSLGLEADIDFSTFYNQGTIKSLQSLYVNNKGNAAELVIVMNGTTQSITIPPQAQAYIPILNANPPTLKITCTNAAAVIFLHALNFFVPPYMWNQTFTVTIASIDAIIVNGRLNVRTTPQGLSADPDRSGTITTGGTGQLLMAANATRAQWNLQNPSTATEILQFSKISIAGPWYTLNAGQFAGDGEGTIYQGNIWVVAATTGHAFTADEGTL